jgi:hypothetical protein
MLKDADHLSEVKRMRLAEKELEPWQPYYEVGIPSVSATLSFDGEV